MSATTSPAHVVDVVQAVGPLLLPAASVIAAGTVIFCLVVRLLLVRSRYYSLLITTASSHMALAIALLALGEVYYADLAQVARAQERGQSSAAPASSFSELLATASPFWLLVLAFAGAVLVAALVLASRIGRAMADDAEPWPPMNRHPLE